jgi:hypothetical protein
VKEQLAAIAEIDKMAPDDPKYDDAQRDKMRRMVRRAGLISWLAGRDAG